MLCKKCGTKGNNANKVIYVCGKNLCLWCYEMKGA